MSAQPSNLKELSRMNPETMPLEEIALLVARERYPELCLQSYRNRLDEFGRNARHRIGGVVGGRAIAKGLSHYLFHEEGFRPNRHDYYDPSNSYFNDVLDQRTGIPISLSVLYVAVAKRLQLPVAGVAFPGHFLVQYHEPGDTFYIDTFNYGSLLSAESCQQRLREQYGESLPYRSEFLEPATHREILIRMLTNLKMCYMLRKKFDVILTILNQILLFTAEGADELKERGLIYFHLECFNAALNDLESYLAYQPHTSDRKILQKFVLDLKDRVTHIQ